MDWKNQYSENEETLSMIAHLGVFPSKADKKAAESRPFTRFRTAVRVVIAVLRYCLSAGVRSFGLLNSTVVSSFKMNDI